MCDRTLTSKTLLSPQQTILFVPEPPPREHRVRRLKGRAEGPALKSIAQTPSESKPQIVRLPADFPSRLPGTLVEERRLADGEDRRGKDLGVCCCSFRRVIRSGYILQTPLSSERGLCLEFFQGAGKEYFEEEKTCPHGCLAPHWHYDLCLPNFSK
jgi:hypothetical protein